MLKSADAPIGLCVLQCIKDQRMDGRAKLDLSLDELKAMARLGTRHIDIECFNILEDRIQ